ncbi:GNAT family N-acetyltransferase [Gleimia hominis]|uniref:GNAT family N-acetyltransferase n=1 Tax=Gleimia hominis TaxID=595468 RepID=A0ABU3IC05_9ACTO|nr:GNAT family N-acetyltransferase [Gleimia hominis]MDT3767002.1 GNAT family N-acetyltransferase [Gleimia hominis]
MPIERIKTPTDELKQAMDRLIPQLSRSSKPLEADGLKRLLDQECVHFLVYRSPDTGNIEGMLTLVIFDIPTGRRAWIEDVVVLDSTRGKGAGQRLVEAAIKEAEESQCRTIDLTSRPTREAANRLYKRCGFELRETNVYRYGA